MCNVFWSRHGGSEAEKKHWLARFSMPCQSPSTWISDVIQDTWAGPGIPTCMEILPTLIWSWSSACSQIELSRLIAAACVIMRTQGEHLLGGACRFPWQPVISPPLYRSREPLWGPMLAPCQLLPWPRACLISCIFSRITWQCLGWRWGSRAHVGLAYGIITWEGILAWGRRCPEHAAGPILLLFNDRNAVFVLQATRWTEVAHDFANEFPTASFA